MTSRQVRACDIDKKQLVGFSESLDLAKLSIWKFIEEQLKSCDTDKESKMPRYFKYLKMF